MINISIHYMKSAVNGCIYQSNARAPPPTHTHTQLLHLQKRLIIKHTEVELIQRDRMERREQMEWCTVYPSVRSQSDTLTGTLISVAQPPSSDEPGQAEDSKEHNTGIEARWVSSLVELLHKKHLSL